MNRRWSTPILIVLIVGLLFGGLAARARLLEARRSAGLAPTEFAKLPPVGAASVLLLGGFRGIAVDVLWMRAISCMDRRQYVEARALIELITQIQPRFVSVWAFQALVIAYDISAQEPDARDQWPWIKDAVDFLKKGIALNPESGDLWFYLGYIYTNKMGQEPYFELACERDTGTNNYEDAANAYDRSRNLSWGPAFPFPPRVVEGAVFFAWLSRSEQVFRRATLGDDLNFSPETLAEAGKYLDRCRIEAAHLQTRYPKDAVYESLGARIDLAEFDGYLAQISRALAEGNGSEASVARARKLLDKSLPKLHNCRLKYPGNVIAGVFHAKEAEAWTRIPDLLVRRAVALASAPDATADDVRRAGQMVREAQQQLDRLPEAVRSMREVVVLEGLVRRLLQKTRDEK